MGPENFDIRWDPIRALVGFRISPFREGDHRTGSIGRWLLACAISKASRSANQNVGRGALGFTQRGNSSRFWPGEVGVISKCYSILTFWSFCRVHSAECRVQSADSREIQMELDCCHWQLGHRVYAVASWNVGGIPRIWHVILSGRFYTAGA